MPAIDELGRWLDEAKLSGSILFFVAHSYLVEPFGGKKASSSYPS
jgi:hypothetical protein